MARMISAEVTGGLKEKELVVIRRITPQTGSSSTKSALSGRKGP